MKPLHIGLLIAAGALGGAVVMKLTDRPAHLAVDRAATPPTVAPVKIETPAPPVPAAPATGDQPIVAPPADAVPASSHPSPFATRQAARPAAVQRPRTETASSAPVRPAPVAIEPAASIPPPVSNPTPTAPEPAAPAHEPDPVPAIRPEPERVTSPPPQPEPHRVTLSPGTLLRVRLLDGLSSDRNTQGDAFTATLEKELVIDGFVIAERGARLEGRVVSSDRGGRVSGVASLGVELKRIRLSDGQWINLQTETFERKAEASRGDDAAKVGAGAAIGAVIGAIAGGGKGAAIGAGAGGAAGAGTVMATRGKAAALPSEMRLSFRLNVPVAVTEQR